MGDAMSVLGEQRGAVVAAIRRELDRIVEEQQQLADDLAALWGAIAPAEAVRRMQAFDLLRQRLVLMSDVLAVMDSTPPEGLAQAVPACLTLTALRRDFAEALGVPEKAAADDGDDVELF